jgi:hypothetical protein
MKILTKFKNYHHNVSELYFSNLGKPNNILIFYLSSRILYFKETLFKYSFLIFYFQLSFI